MRIRNLLLLTAPLLLCGCGATELIGKPTPDLDKAYTVTADINVGSYSASADITRNSAGDWDVSFTEPSYLMGVRLSLSDGSMTASLGDISVTADSSDVYTLVPDIIATVLDSLSDLPAENISENEGIITLATAFDGDKAMVTTDTNGELLTLKCPAQRLSVKFSDQEDILPIETVETFEFIIEE